MLNHLVSFIVYTFAMVGVLLVAFVVYKKTMLNSPIRKNSGLKIEDMLSLPDRKILYVINCRNELFLIASSSDKVSFISKLENKNISIKDAVTETQTNEITKQNGSVKSLLKELSDKNKKRNEY